MKDALTVLHFLAKREAQFQGYLERHTMRARAGQHRYRPAHRSDWAMWKRW